MIDILSITMVLSSICPLIIHSSIQLSTHPLFIRPSIIHHTDVSAITGQPDVYVYELWRNPENHQENKNTESNPQPADSGGSCGNVFRTSPVETSVPVDCIHSLNTSGTDGTSFHLQQEQQNLSKTSTGAEQNRSSKTHLRWDPNKFCCSAVNWSQPESWSSVNTYTHTSLVECEAGVVIATVSLFRAAGGVVLTAVAPDSWC